MTTVFEKLLKKIKWCSPKKGMVKIYTDATLDLTNKAIGLDAVYRDDKGMVL